MVSANRPCSSLLLHKYIQKDLLLNKSKQMGVGIGILQTRLRYQLRSYRQYDECLKKCLICHYIQVVSVYLSTYVHKYLLNTYLCTLVKHLRYVMTINNACLIIFFCQLMFK